MKQLSLFNKRKKNPVKKWGRPITTHTGARRKRIAFKAHRPLHITLRLQDGLPNLRCKRGSQLIKHAIIGAHENGIKVVHFAILSNHLHLVIEARDSDTLFKGMRSFCVRLAIHLRRWAGKTKQALLDSKSLFRGRYHVQELKTPRQVKHVLGYVLMNPAKHFGLAPYIDLYTSAAIFAEWEKLLGQSLTLKEIHQQVRRRLQTFLAPPGSWLLRQGWAKTAAHL